jgi:hypothetical protein
MDNINIPKISYKFDGRFGNNLFQYLATKNFIF